MNTLVSLILEPHSGAREAFAYPAEDGFFLVLEPQVGSCWLIFRIFVHSLAYLRPKSGLEPIFFDFSSILVGFWEGFGKFFRRFFPLFAKIVILCENQQNTAWAHEF